jgi:hypothetical protein
MSLLETAEKVPFPFEKGGFRGIFELNAMSKKMAVPTGCFSCFAIMQ